MKNENVNSKFMTIRQAAENYGLTTSIILKSIQQKKLIGYRFNDTKNWLVKPEDIEKLIKRAKTYEYGGNSGYDY